MKFLPILRLSQLHNRTADTMAPLAETASMTSERGTAINLIKHQKTHLDLVQLSFFFITFLSIQNCEALGPSSASSCDDPSLPSSPECESSTSISAANIQEIIKLRALVEAVLGQMPGMPFYMWQRINQTPQNLARRTFPNRPARLC